MITRYAWLLAICSEEQNPFSHLFYLLLVHQKISILTWSVLEGSRFTALSLEAFANYLNILTHDSNRIKLFSNKPSVANRICFEIKSLFPDSCGECSEEYSVKCASENPPALRCFLCFQGCHNCEQATALLPDPTLPILSGPMCHEINNTVKTIEDISRVNTSKSASRQPPSSTAPTVQHRLSNLQFPQLNLNINFRRYWGSKTKIQKRLNSQKIRVRNPTSLKMLLRLIFVS